MKSSYVFISLYLLIGLVPYFGTADKLHPQTLYLSLLNFSSIIYIINSIGIKRFFNSFSKNLRYKQSIFFFIFFLIASLSIFQSVNKIQSFIALVEIFNIFLAFIIMIYFISKINNLKTLIYSFVLVLSILELTASFYPYLRDIFLYGSPLGRSLEYRGFTGSVNISSYLLLIKLPFLYHYAFILKRYRWVYVALITLSIYAITVIFQTRSAILMTLFLSFIFCLAYLYNNSINGFSIKQNIGKIIIIIVIPLFAVFLLSNFQSIYFNKTESVQDRLSSINLEEYSTNSRFRYYTQALKSISEKPLRGIGIGNWQLESIKRDSENIRSYIVPYHVHNDFLQLAAETGILGSLMYFLIILSLIFSLLKRVINKIKIKKPLDYDFLILASLSIYIFDSLFNFPYARVLQQINLFFIIAYTINFFKNRELNLRVNYSPIAILIIFACIPLTLYSSARLFKSSIDQRILLSHYNLVDYTIPLEVIDKMEMNYSDLTVTTIPMKSLKGFFYMKNNKFREAIDFFNEGTGRNPYLYFSETYKAFSFLNLDQLDSADFFANISFNKIPGNRVHFANLALTKVYLKDSVGLKEAYQKAKFKEEIHDEMYLTAMSDIINKDESDFALESFSLNADTDNDGLKRSYYTLKIGQNQMYEAAKFNELGEYAFKNKEFEIALVYFENAAKLNPYEFPYIENFANANLQVGNFEEAVDILNDLIDNKNSLSIKAKYMRVLGYLNMKKLDIACPLINEIKNHPQIKGVNLASFCLK